MAKTTSIDSFAAAVHEILEEYGDDLRENVAEAAKAVTKKGAQAVRKATASTFGGSGKYAKGWTSRFETGRVSSQGVIYNGDVPGLPHLLENGHAKRGGGRVAGRTHIKPVEEEIVKEFEKAVKDSV